MVVFQSDIFRQEVVNPLLAAIINVVVDRNFSYQRETPLIFSADEFPTIYLPQAPRWVNEHRSKGFCGIFGFQSFPQIRETYGKEQSDVMLAGAGSHFWFNPGDQNTAKDQSSFLGEEEITIENKSKTRQRGEGRGSISKSQQTQTKPLITAYEINQFKVGECIYLNPGFSDGDRESIPLHLERVEIPEEDISLHEECEEMWLNSVRDRLIQREKKRRPDMDFEQQLQARFDEAERLLPLPPDEEDEEENKEVDATDVIPDL
jgi:type IV secretory pathway TraG/TraD family ATPase VirD4